MRELLLVLTKNDENVSLDLAALQLATIETPELDPMSFLPVLDSHAAEFRASVPEKVCGPEFLAEFVHYLAEDLGFQGNDADYYNPANSCLNHVLLERTGIPITLSILYMEIARRLGKRIAGIGMPGHFLLQFEEGGFSTFIDPFHGGQLLSAADCYALAAKVTGRDQAANSQALAPVTPQHILIRMLHNLRAIYFERQDAAKASRVLDLLIAASPALAELYKQRAVCQTHLQKPAEAAQDFRRYLQLAPDAPDRRHVTEQLERLS